MRFRRSEGFSLLELMVVLAIMGALSFYMAQYGTQPQNLFNEVESRFSGKMEEGFFFKNLNKQLENSYVVRSSIIDCPDSEPTNISSKTDPITARKIKLEAMGDQFSLVYSSLNTLGGIPSADLQNYLDANMRLKFIEKQLELIEVQEKFGGLVSASEKTSLATQKTQIETTISSFSFAADPIEISVVDANKFNENNFVLVSSIGNQKKAGLYKIISVDKVAQKISISFTDFTNSDHKCTLPTNKTIEDIIKESLLDSASFSSSVRMNVVHFVRYSIAKHNADSLKIVYNEYLPSGAPMARDVFFNFSKFELEESWAPTMAGANPAAIGAGLMALGGAKFLTTLEYNSVGDKISKTTAETSYFLNAVSKNNYGADTSARSTYPIAPDGYGLVSSPFIAKLCADVNTADADFTVNPNCPASADYTEFFYVYGHVKAAPNDISIRIATEGLQCWDPVDGINTLTAAGDDWIKIRDIGPNSTPNPTLYKNDDGTMSLICRALRNAAGNFIPPVGADGKLDLSFVLSYFDHNDGVLKNKSMSNLNDLFLAGNQTVTITTPGACLKVNGIAGIVKPILASTVAGAPAPIIYYGADSCVWDVGGSNDCSVQLTGLNKVKFYPKVKVGGVLDHISVNCP